MRRRKARSRAWPISSSRPERSSVDGAMQSCGTAVAQHGVAHGGAAGEHVIGRGAAVAPLDAQTGRGVALRVEVDDQHMLADGRQRGAEIDGGRGLADAALLVGDRQHPRAGGIGTSGRSCRRGRPAGRPGSVAACRSWSSFPSIARGPAGLSSRPSLRSSAPSFCPSTRIKTADNQDCALLAGLAGHFCRLNCPIFSGFGQFSIYILTLGEQCRARPERSKERLDRKGFSTAIARAPSQHPQVLHSFRRISRRVPGALAHLSPSRAPLRAKRKPFFHCFQPNA